MFDTRQSIAQNPPSDPQIKEIQSCLSLQGYISQYNVIICILLDFVYARQFNYISKYFQSGLSIAF